MSDTNGPYLFDVGVIALAHTTAPVRDAALSYVRAAIAGDIDAIVPCPAVLGAHTVLTTYYEYSNTDASRLLQNFMDAKRIQWYDSMPVGMVQDSLSQGSAANVDGWDGYYAQVAIEEGANTVLTIDDDFERFEAFHTEIILSPDEFAELNRFLENWPASKLWVSNILWWDPWPAPILLASSPPSIQYDRQGPHVEDSTDHPPIGNGDMTLLSRDRWSIITSNRFLLAHPDGTNPDLLLGLLNTSVTKSVIESHGRVTGGGAVNLSSTDLRSLRVVDPAALTDEQATNIANGFRELSNGNEEGIDKIDNVVIEVLDLDVDIEELQTIAENLKLTRRNKGQEVEPLIQELDELEGQLEMSFQHAGGQQQGLGEFGD